MNITPLRRRIYLILPLSLLLILLLSFEPLQISAQDIINTSLIQGKLKINVNNIAINGELTLRGLTADFPYPILTTISVIEDDTNIVTGLADPTKWLGETDRAENGRLISEIWQPVLEYHQEDTTIPPEPNLYNQSPSALFTEVRKTELLPTSTMLVMDVTGSMKDALDTAKIGVLSYVDLFRFINDSSVDRGGLIRFRYLNGIPEYGYVPMTNDTSILKNSIRAAVDTGKTILYDALMLAIDSTKLENGRRGIIVYTDGNDNESKTKCKTVIDSARVNSLPIYTIALGDSVNKDSLQQIADSTGGVYFEAATAKEMKAIYKKLSEFIQNYYVMAHGSPDPDYNRTWRLVDITVNRPGEVGGGVGRYFVGGPPISSKTDITLSQSVFTDTSIELEGDTVQAVLESDVYSYSLKIENRGPITARAITLWDVIPDSVTISNFNIPPASKSANTYIWQFDSLPDGDSIIINFDATVADFLPNTPFPLINNSGLTAKNDTLTENNFSSSKVYAISVKPPEDWQPFIEAMPPIIEVGQNISVRVQISAPIESWDILVYLSNDQVISDYADEFIGSTQLMRDKWYDVKPKFTNTKLFTQAKQEQIIFELRVNDVFGEFKNAKDTVTVRSNNAFRIDRNIFKPDREDDLVLSFKLSSNRNARLDIFDITGTNITKLTEDQYLAGWNTYQWNGLTEKGQKIGSGFYIITLRSGGYYSWKKLMIVQ